MIVTDVIRNGTTLYYLSSSFAGLFSYDLITGKSKCLCRFNGYELFARFICTHMVLHNKNIIIAPGCGNTFYSYNIDSDALRKITFNDGLYSTYEIGLNEKFSFHCVIDDSVYFVGYNSLQIVKINREGTKGTVTLLDIPKEINGGNTTRLAIEGIVEDSMIYIPFIDVPFILKFNTISGHIDLYECGVDFKILGMGKIGSHKYIYSLSEIRILEVSFTEGKECYCKLLDYCEGMNIVPNMRNICCAVTLNSGLYIIPFRGDKVIKIDADNKCLQCVGDVSEFSGERTFFVAGKINENTFWAYSEEKDTLIIYDSKKETYLRYMIPLFNINEETIDKSEVKNFILREAKAELKIEDFIKMIY